MRIAIIGCGLIGQKRAVAAQAMGAKISWAVDTTIERAEAVASRFGARPDTDWRTAIAAEDTDVVFVATSHDNLSAIACAALGAGKHVLLEKPGGRNLADVLAVRDAARAAGRIAKVGYNHRFHPALLKARKLVDSGETGPLMFIRGRYGHGGRPGYQKEWRFDPEISGGGQLIDQGSHLVDLAHWFLGDFVGVQGAVRRCFWDSAVEDNVFMTLSSKTGQIASLHATWTEWKNMFSLEIYGRDAKLDINGLGGSYGVESLTFYKMLPQMGPPETTRWEWPFPDRSWEKEVEEFMSAIRERRVPLGHIDDAVQSMTVIDRLYAQEPLLALPGVGC